jgi:MinD-like ATPase involved in chromosome partitioning or flagellar assembly
MAIVMTFHSIRGGTGKSSVLANVAVLAAEHGARVGVVDTDLQAPAMEALLGVPASGRRPALADYPLGRCEIEEAIHPFTVAGARAPLHIVGARRGTAEIGEVLRHGYDVGVLSEGFERLVECLSLDVLFIDTHAGLCNETMTAMVSAHRLVTVNRADRLSLTGADDVVELADRLSSGERSVIINMVSQQAGYLLRRRTECAYRAPVGAILPFARQMQHPGDRVFALEYPRHPLAAAFRALAHQVADAAVGPRSRKFTGR